MGKPLSEEEIARRRKALGEHGSIAEAARALGMRPTSLSEWLRNDVERPKPKPKPKPEPPPPPEPREIHNAAFWRRKAREQERRLGEMEHLIEQLGGIRGVPYEIPAYAIRPSSGAKARSVVGVHWSDVHMGNVLSSGSVPGYSEYGDDLRVVVEPPQQNLFLIHSRWGLRERMPIQLEEPSPPPKPRVRVPAWQ